MSHRTVDVGPGMLALAGLLLLLGLFLAWFDGDSAWRAFESLDLALAALGAAGIAIGAGRVIEDARAGLGVALAAVVIVAVQLIDPPPGYVNADLGTGAWLSLAAALLMLAGAAQTLASFTVSVDVRGRERRKRVEVVDRRTEAEPKVTRLLPEDDQRTEAMQVVDEE